MSKRALCLSPWLGVVVALCLTGCAPSRPASPASSQPVPDLSDPTSLPTSIPILPMRPPEATEQIPGIARPGWAGNATGQPWLDLLPKELISPANDEGHHVSLAYGVPNGWQVTGYPEDVAAAAVVFGNEAIAGKILLVVTAPAVGTPTAVCGRIAEAYKKSDGGLKVSGWSGQADGGAASFGWTGPDGQTVGRATCRGASGQPMFTTVIVGSWAATAAAQGRDGFDALLKSVRAATVP